MRIGQLARQLGIPPSDILGFLSAQNIETEAGANARIGDEVLGKVLQHFAPEKKVEEVVEIVEEEPAVETPEAETPVEVIRVSKVELQGLKVIGKIDLPEPKKKEEAPAPILRKEQPRREQRPWKNPMEQQRQQEEREKEQKKKEQADVLREKRANHYYNKVKSVPTKPVRKIEEQTVVEDIDVKEPPKGIFGKFFHWLKT